MKLLQTNIKIRFSKLVVALSIILTVAGCNPTKYVPEGEALLKKNEISIIADDNKPDEQISKSEIKPYIRQVPNKKIFGRITSYNVCYTKLLRGLFHSQLNSDDAGDLCRTQRSCGFARTVGEYGGVGRGEFQ